MADGNNCFTRWKLFFHGSSDEETNLDYDGDDSVKDKDLYTFKSNPLGSDGGWSGCFEPTRILSGFIRLLQELVHRVKISIDSELRAAIGES